MIRVARLLTLTGCCAGLLPARIVANQSEVLSVIDPRSLAAAIARVEGRCRCPITYEDPPYELGDGVAVGPTASRDGSAVVPRGGYFQFSIAVRPGERDPRAIEGALVSIINSYAASGYPGMFHVERSDGMVGVVPERSVLSTIVHVESSRNQSASDALATALLALRAHGGAQVGLATSPTTLLMQTRVVSRELDAPIHDVLVNILQATHRPLSWRLLYDIATRQYFLNIHSVR